MKRRIATGIVAAALLLASGILSPSSCPAGEASEAGAPDSRPSQASAPGTVPATSPSPDPASGKPADPAATAKPLTPAAAAGAPAPAAVPSLIAPPSEKAKDRVLSPGELDVEVTRILVAEDEDERIGDDFFDNASEEVGKGKEGVFAGLTRPIDKFLRYFQTTGRKKMELYLSRSGKYTGMMQKILARYGLPDDLVYLALIESGFSPKAYSVAKAAGPWQFIVGTGRRYGLRIDWWADERRDAEKSTHAAASYLRDLYGMFESWPLAAAAYNAGEGKIMKAVSRYKSEDYVELIRHRYLKQETKDYVPKMLAALTIAKEPDKYGFGHVEYEAPIDLRTAVVPGGTDLAATARILDVPCETLREWNPELRRFCTPPNRENYVLQLSADVARLAEERMEEICTQAKITFLRHDVRKGETLKGLATKYGASIDNLRELNGLKKDSLKRTSRLVIPVVGLTEEEAVPGKEVSPDQLTMAHMRVEERSRRARLGVGRGKRRAAESGETVTVRKGDTLSRIAKAHGVSAKALARANDLPAGAKLKVGRRLALPDSDAAGKEPPAGKRTADKGQEPRKKKTLRYKVHKGDTLEKIARVYGVTPDALAVRNRLRQGDPLRLGAVLVIPLES
ncbi:MAG: LysM peptidoglycan-binding domain-containing protein [Deltaproteobacteria bacterium]|nr:MAG: LysM peptidoglycan-binding domain-containing protein [Deltaproteobacteria bacterium]